MARAAPFRTVYLPRVLSVDHAEVLYHQICLDVDWHEGIRSRKGQTRQAYAVRGNEDFSSVITDAILKALQAFQTAATYTVDGIYLNFYRDGNDWLPSHSHKGTLQLVISLGCCRTLRVGSKTYILEPGSAIIFGGSQHSIEKDLAVTDGRISIATFITKNTTKN